MGRDHAQAVPSCDYRRPGLLRCESREPDGRCLELVTGRKRDPIPALVEIHRRAEMNVHAEKPRQLCGLIDTTGSWGLDIELLEGEKVGIHRSDDVGGPFDVGNAVAAFAMMDIEGRNPERVMWHGDDYETPYATIRW